MQTKLKHNKYNIDIISERNLWMNNIINNWIKINNRCPNCNQISLKLKKIKSVINPLKLQFNKASCRKIVNIRENTIFNVCLLTPISFLIYVIEEFIKEEKMQLK